MTDEADQAEQYEEKDRELALKRMRERPKEKPKYDENGDRLCVDCGSVIPFMRVHAVDAVTCVPCQMLRDEEERIYR